MTEKPYSPGLQSLFEVVRRLRADDGCPWDREQTHQSLRPYLLEETYEVLEAIDTGNDAKLREELGDLLLQVAMHAQIAEEQGRFDAVAVSEAEAAKMVARHPHVFGAVEVADADEVLRNWEQQKQLKAASEGSTESVVDRVPSTLPALAWTLGMQKRAARIGFDYSGPVEAAEGVVEVARELAAAAGEEEAFNELGDLLFALVNLARKRKLNPEDALRASGQRFRSRFKKLEVLAAGRGIPLRDIPPDTLAGLWTEAAGIEG